MASPDLRTANAVRDGQLLILEFRDVSSCDNPIKLTAENQDSANADAWTRFVQIYAPVIHRFGIRRGLQDADAADLTQDVLRAVSHSIEKFEYDPETGKFRCWLLTIARYTLCRMQQLRSRQPTASGDSAVQKILEASPAHDPDLISWTTSTLAARSSWRLSMFAARWKKLPGWHFRRPPLSSRIQQESQTNWGSKSAPSTFRSLEFWHACRRPSVKLSGYDNNQQKCPPTEHLQALIAGTLAVDDETAVAAHLANCDACQSQIEKIAAPAGFQADVAHWLSDSTDHRICCRKLLPMQRPTSTRVRVN